MPTFRELETRVAKDLEAKMVEHEKAIQAAMREALDSMYADMTKIYEKWAVGGKLTKAEMTRYNKYITMEKKMLSLVDPAIKASIAEIKRIAPEMYNASFFEYAWAMDNGNGVRLSYGQIQESAIKKLFDPSNPKNIEIIEAIKTFPIEAKKYIRAALLKGLTTGKGYNAMAADLKDAIGNKALWRALRILRTEGQRAISMAQYDLYKKADELGIRGIDVWDSALDGRTRHDHRNADGQKRGKDGYFNIGGYPALYPLDPNLPPEQAINCIPENAIPIGFNVEKLFKRYYNGVLIHVKTANGFEFSVTPNHPILTDKGWIPANLLNKSSNIIGLDFGKQFDSTNLNINNRPLIIGKVFNLFKVVGRSERQLGTNFQFHGDGRNSDVNIERVNRHLWNSYKSSFYKPLIQFRFASSKILHCFLSCYGALRKFLFFSFHSAYYIVGSFSKILSFLKGCFGHSSKHSSRSSTNSDVITNQDIPDSSTADIKLHSNRFFGKSVNVCVDNVVFIESVPYYGHVYNLQTKEGYYILYNDNGKMSIVHNCRCHLRKEIEGYAPQVRRSREEGIIPYQTYKDWEKSRNTGITPPPVITKSKFTPASTIEEANAWLKRELGISNKTKLSLDALNETNSILYDLYNKYPANELKFLTSVRAGGVYGEGGMVRIGLNESIINNKKTFLEKLKKDVETLFHPKGCDTLKSVIDHEYMHCLMMDISRENREEFISEARKIRSEYKNALGTDDNVGISRYASTDLDEFVSEAFSMARNSSNPSPYAVKILDLVNRFFGGK